MSHVVTHSGCLTVKDETMDLSLLVVSQYWSAKNRPYTPASLLLYSLEVSLSFEKVLVFQGYTPAFLLLYSLEVSLSFEKVLVFQGYIPAFLLLYSLEVSEF